VQKHHSGSPPRVGVVPILLAMLLGLYFLAQAASAADAGAYQLLLNIVLASLPVVVLGLADDLTKKVPPKVRLAGAAAAAVLGMALLDNFVPRVNVPGLDSLVQLAPVAVMLTVLMVAGFTNAMNIVDGLNGLSSGLAVLMLSATAFVAAALGDTVVLTVCVVLAAAVVGFMLVNFPRGLMFLGDGAAYLIGFTLAQIWMLLLARNAEVSTWFVVAVAAHPTMETVFSMYRRRIHRGRGGAFTEADRLHLHSLVYRRRMLGITRRLPWMETWVPNSSASALLMAFAALPMAAACLAPNNTLWCMAVFALYCLGYLMWFKSLVGFGKLRPLQRPMAPAAALARSMPTP
jgi:UDP-GlcNAc:undecaprenyl-phosphate/decaprenyl-phosphate GlcNAc-1-phosphate transferase